MNTRIFFAATATALSLASAPVVAQMKHDGMDHSGHDMGQMTMGTPKGDDSQSSRDYAIANAKMHEAMDIIFTGDSDVDFVKGMIAHHQGAIDMAEVVLQHGKDPQIRKLAEEIIEAQRGEIAMMQQWLVDKGK